MPPAAGCIINVVFTPAIAGTRNASIFVTDDAQGGPHSIALNGTGVDFALVTSRPRRPARNAANTVIIAGQSTTFSFSVRPSGGAGLSAGAFNEVQVVLKCSGLPVLATCNVQPAMIDLTQAETPVEVTVKTNAGSSLSAGRRSKRLRGRKAGTPAGNYVVRVTAQSGAVHRSADFTLTIR